MLKFALNSRNASEVKPFEIKTKRIVNFCQVKSSQFVNFMGISLFGERLRLAFKHAKNAEIARRLGVSEAAVKNYIDGVVFTINCHAAGDAFTIAGCTPSTCHGQNATSCSANPTELILCPPFWALSSNERAKTIFHEIFHVTFAQIDDWTAPDSLNAHCYSQFVALLNGFNPISRCH